MLLAKLFTYTRFSIYKKTGDAANTKTLLLKNELLKKAKFVVLKILNIINFPHNYVMDFYTLTHEGFNVTIPFFTDVWSSEGYKFTIEGDELYATTLYQYSSQEIVEIIIIQ